MSKIASRYLEIDPWRIVEKGFHRDRDKVSESIFSVGNEFMGVRGYFEEGYSGPSMLGSYFNGVFEYAPNPKKEWFNGTPDRYHFLVNTVDWLHTRISAEGEKLDLATSKITGFERSLDMREGVLRRSFVWELSSGQKLRVCFERLTSMVDAPLGLQRLAVEALEGSANLQIEAGLEFATRGNTHWNPGESLWSVVKAEAQDGVLAILGKLPESGRRVGATMRLAGELSLTTEVVTREKYIGWKMTHSLVPGRPLTLDRIVANTVERNADIADDTVWEAIVAAAKERHGVTFEKARADQAAWWAQVWERTGVSIEGDPENEQGVRFGIFQLTQTYHGLDPANNVAAKGLTSEHYGGYAWWDTETYCLPFYVFTNPRAARNLLGFRHLTLPGAVRRSASDDCEGARYPMCTIDGDESCIVWQHGDLEIHVGEAVAYGIWHYVNITGDREFLYSSGMEMLIQISRFYASRGGWGQQTGKFGFYGVMGPDEFHMMVDNNCYTNFMAGKVFAWTLEAMEEMRRNAPERLEAIAKKTQLRPEEVPAWQHIAENIYLPQNRKTGVYEQHQGYFNYPHTDISKIPPTDYPLQNHWSYYRTFRTDMHKQPDVLLLHFFFSHEFSERNKRANYEFYEPRCSHESSLSPGVHSILAAELGQHDKAFSYWGHSARLDLDDYNRNTDHGLHTTSMAASWLNVVYGFGGLRTDGPCLSFRPSLPGKWNQFSFKLQIREGTLTVTVTPRRAEFAIAGIDSLEIEMFGKRHVVAAGTVLKVPMPKKRVARRMASKKPVTGIIFDLDGVIVSTDEFHYQAWQRLADEQGIPFDREVNHRLRGVSRMESLDILLEKAGREYSDAEKLEMATRKNGYYLEALETRLTPRDILPGVMPCLESLRQRGLKLAIGSSSKNSPTILRKIGLENYFDATADGNDITQSKPHPEVFLLAAERLGLPPEQCLVVEDAEAGVTAALAAGMRVVAVGAATGDPRAQDSKIKEPTIRLISSTWEAVPCAPRNANDGRG